MEGYYRFMPDWISRRVALNAVSGFLGAYGWVSFFCFLYLVTTWAATAPHIPDPGHGFVFPHNEHGSITYFSGFQGTSCALLFGTSPLFFMSGLALSPKKNVVFKTGRLGFSMKWEPDDPRKIRRVAMAIGAAAAPILIFLIGPGLVRGLNSIGFVAGF